MFLVGEAMIVSMPNFWMYLITCCETWCSPTAWLVKKQGCEWQVHFFRLHRYHSYGKPPFFVGKSSINGWFSIAALVYWRVVIECNHPKTNLHLHHLPPFYILSYGYGSIPINTIFRGMNIHLPAILMFTRGIGFWPIPILSYHSNLIIYHVNGWSTMDPLITMDPSFTTRASFTIAPKSRPRSLTKTRESWRFLSPKEVPFWTVGDFFLGPLQSLWVGFKPWEYHGYVNVMGYNFVYESVYIYI